VLLKQVLLKNKSVPCRQAGNEVGVEQLKRRGLQGAKLGQALTQARLDAIRRVGSD